MKKQLFLILTMLLPTMAMAYDAEIDGIYYNFEGTEATVTYQRMESGDYYSDYSGDVIIPQSVTYKGNTYEVTNIDYDAFKNCHKLTSVVIPNSVTSIGYGAFSYCHNLASIQFPESVTDIDGYAFEGTAWFDNQPDGVVYVGKVAYKYKGEVPENTTINITDGTVSISPYAFKDCNGLSSITIPGSVMNIGYRAFDGTAWYNSQLDGVVYAGKVAYKYKGSMPENTVIDVKEGTLGIAKYAFDGCSNLKSINIPEGVTIIGECAFRGCTNLTTVSIPVSVNNIGHSAFESCWKLYSVTIPEGVTNIGSHTFYSCFALTSITLPKSLKTIGSNAFFQCTKLSSITIPEGVTTIGSYVFDHCWILSSITIPKSVISLGKYAIYGCSSLSSIIVHEENPVYDSRNGCNAIIETASNTLITGCMNTIIPEGVTCISDYAFYQCSGLQSLIIPKSVTSIGTGAFNYCNGLTSIEVESGNPMFDSRNDCNALIETASNALIMGCSNTIIPVGVTTIGNNAFYECDGLTSISIPEGVTSIGDNAFKNCYGLTSIIFPESITSIGYSAFSRTPWFENQPDGLVYAGKVAYTYKGTMPDNTIIELNDGTLGIAGNAFSSCTGLTSINIPNSVTNIGVSAFSGCQNLNTIIIPNGVTSIGGGAFNGCQALTSINIPEGVTSIENFTFEGCNNLASITIPKNVTRIGEYAFFNCSNLTSIVIPKGVTSIGGSAFDHCTSISSITIPEGVTCIGSHAFYDCNGLTTIKIPESVTEIGYHAFDTRSSLSAVKVGMKNPVELLPGTFWGCATLYVPYGCKAAYQSAEHWQDFREIIECNFSEVDNQFIAAGYSTTIEIGVNNFETNLVGFQMDLALPEGVGIDKAGCTLSSRITDENQELTIGKLESSAYRITSTSLSLTPISGNDGTLLNLKLIAADGCVGGQATISNIIFSTAESEKIIMGDKTFDISILYNLTYKVDGQEYKDTCVAYGSELTPEAEPTKEGNTFGGWSEIPETMPNHDVEITGRFYIYGDVNTDEDVDVVDVVDIARFVVATPSVSFREKLADLNKDNTVNIADAVALVNHIVGDQNFARAMTPSKPYNYNLCQIQLLSTQKNALSLCLDGDADFTAFQFEVKLPQGVDITAMRINGQRKDGHQLLYNKVADNRYRVTVLSLSNAAFKGNEGELLNISVNGQPTDMISVNNILFVAKNGTGIAFDALSLSEATDITNVHVNEGNNVIYDLQGRKLSKVQRGMNIVNGRKVILNK